MVVPIMILNTAEDQHFNRPVQETEMWRSNGACLRSLRESMAELWKLALYRSRSDLCAINKATNQNTLADGI